MALPGGNRSAIMEDDSQDQDEALLDRLAKNREASKAAEKTRKDTMNLLASMLKKREAKEAADRATKAKLQAAKEAQAAEEEDEVAEPVPDVPELPDASHVGLADEPEPPTYDEHLWQPLQVEPAPPLDLQPVVLPDLAGADGQQPQDVFTVLLQQQMVFQLLPASPPLLQLLFKASVHTGNQHATQLLIQHYKGLKAHTDAVWVPCLSDYLEAIQAAGYCSKAAPAASSKTGKGTGAAKSSKGGAGKEAGTDTCMQVDVPPGGAGTTSNISSSAVRAKAVDRLHQCLQLIRVVCEVERQRGVALHDYSRASKVAGCHVLLGLIELQLVPSLRRVLLLELSHTLSALCACWGQLGSSTWDSVVKEVSSHMPQLGPSYQAGLLLVREMAPGDAHHQQLRTACVLSLLASLVHKGGKGGGSSSSKAGSGSDDAGKRALELLKLAGSQPRHLLNSLPLPAAPSEQPEEEQSKVRPDYHKALAVMECVHLVVWDQVYSQDAVSDAQRRVGSALRVYMEDMNQIVNRSRVPSAITLSAALSGWLYLLEINANIESVRGSNAQMDL